MPAVGVFKELVETLLDVLPSDVDVVGVEVTGDGDIVTVWTTTPRELIGRRGSVAAQVRSMLLYRLGRAVTFRVELPDGDVDGVPTTVQQIGGGSVPRPRIWRPRQTRSALGAVPPGWR